MPRKKGQVVLYFRWHGRKLSVAGKTRDEAVAKKALKIAALERQDPEISGDTLVRDWISSWIETYKEGQVNPAWLKDIESLCRRYIVPEIGTLRIRTVKPIQLQRIININSKSKSFNAKLYDIIRQIFRTAYQNRLVARDPSEGLTRAPSQRPKKRRSLTDAEREALLAVLPGHRGEAFCKLMLYAGLRPGECAALTWSDVDMQQRVIHVRKALKSDGVVRPAPKTAAGVRDVPIVEELYLVLKKVREKGDFGFVCVNSRGTPYTKKSIQLMWSSLKREMDIALGAKTYRNRILIHALADDLVLYDLRHTFCTDLQAAGVPINVARELMGHENISVTAQIYTHRSEQSFEDARAKMESFGKKGLPEGGTFEGQKGVIRGTSSQPDAK